MSAISVVPAEAVNVPENDETPAVPNTSGLSLPSEIDKEIKRRTTLAYEAQGFVDDDGDVDPKKMQDAAYKILRTRVANSRVEKAEKAITKGELYAAVFTKGPGADGNDHLLDEFDAKVFATLEREVWGLMQAKPSGAMQRRLTDEGSTLVVLQDTIRRNMDKAPAVYLSDNTLLIKEDGLDKEIKALERKTQNLRKQLDALLVSHPELADAVRSELNQTISRTKTELTLPKADLGTPKELAQGSDD